MAATQQPSPNAQSTGGVIPPTARNITLQKRYALIAGIISIVVNIILFVFGFASLFLAALGAYALYIGIRRKAPPLIIVGSIGVVLTVASMIILTLLSL